jgi:predicted adenine nucleotide alpha hydrolase (AANH) superfamily ATPase|uniref:Epoxyqueuosine reductase QueH n=1 Tax=Mesoaciditoga lauensis TaxID=1495039 RepID=A0A7V3REJ3_9BACT
MKVLLHICCAPDATTAYIRLSQFHDVSGYFFNPNVQPFDEYSKRREAVEKLSKAWHFEVIYPEYDPARWFKSVRGLETLREGSMRCKACIAFRLKNSAIFAKENGFDAFATSLTTSPHKDVQFINDIGLRLSKSIGVGYIPSTFRKQNGFLESVRYCKALDLYRQNYCGCLFSLPKVKV